MAHGSAGEDNPVALNVAPMVDIIFCLCIFFMCSFHFKQLEGKLESWLPKKGREGRPDVFVLEEVRITMTWDASTQTVIRRIGGQTYPGDAELVGTIQSRLETKRKFEPGAAAIIDAMPDVPWKDVIKVLDLCKSSKIESVELAAPMPVK
ncbi:MAG: biopolymer transporter ExbD [Planctomycetota bacterium]